MEEKEAPAVKPEVVFIEAPLGDITEGILRVPRFQRPFIWRPKDMINLFDSIYKGYPIGSLLFWESSMNLESLDNVGPLNIPKSSSIPLTYILDGHQRLATLYGTLMLPKTYPRGPKQSDWRWWIWFNLKTKEFVHVKKGKPDPWLFPLRSILKTVDFLEEARRIEKNFLGKASQFINRAEALAQKIKNYRIAVIRTIGGSMTQTVAIFSRLNTQGVNITPDQMVSALTYREGKRAINMAQRIDQILESLSGYRFGGIKRMTIFHSIVAAAGRRIYKSEWENLAEKLKSDLVYVVDIAEESLLAAARFLYEEIKVPGDKLLPYNYQILMLSEFFRLCPNPNNIQKEILIRWFWATSLSGWFAGISTTKINDEIHEMHELAKNSPGSQKMQSLVEPARQFPKNYDSRSARVRALLLFMISLKPLNPKTGKPFVIESILYGYGGQSLTYVFPRAKGSILSNPANRIILEKIPGKSVRDQLVETDSIFGSDVLKSHGINRKAFDALLNNDPKLFIDKRAAYLNLLEQDFIKNLGLKPAEEPGYGEADIDTDDDI